MNTVIRNLLIIILFLLTYSSFSQSSNEQTTNDELVNFKLGTPFKNLKDSLLFEQSQDNTDIYLYIGNRHKKFLGQNVELTRMMFSKRTNRLVSMKAGLRENLSNNKEVAQEADRINKLISKKYGTASKVNNNQECYQQLHYKWTGKSMVIETIYDNLSTSIVITDKIFFDKAVQGF